MNGIQDGTLPLSAAQLDIWMSQKIDPGNAKYNIAEFLEIHGPVIPDVMEVALRFVVEETHALHLRFVENEQGVLQAPRELPDRLIDYIDCSSHDDPWGWAQYWMRSDRSRPVDPASNQLFNYALFQLNGSHFVWYQRYHHLVLDAYGMSLIAKRFAEIYTTIADGSALPDKSMKWIEPLVEDDLHYRSSDQFRMDREFWQGYLNNAPKPLVLSHHPAPTDDFVRQSSGLPNADRDQLNRFASSVGAKLSHVLIAGVAVYLFRLTGEPDLLLRLPVANRRGVQWNIPGMASNVLPLRLRLHPHMNFLDVTQLVSGEVRKVLDRQRYREEDIHRDLPHIDKSFGPLVNIISFDYDFKFAGQHVTALNLWPGPIPDLSFMFYKRTDQQAMNIYLDGNAGSYDLAELQAHQSRLLGLMHTLADNPDVAIGQINILTAHERQQLLHHWNETAHVVDPGNLAELFAQQAARTPSAIAASAGEQSLSYGELDTRANHLAHHLQVLGAGPDVLVGLCLERTFDLLISILAILKAGAAYLPLDPEHPAERIARMLDETNTSILITQAALAGRLSMHRSAMIVLDDEAKHIAQQSGTPPLHGLQPDHLAYVMYTSGSTGTPKGIAITHRNVIELALDRRWQDGSQQRVLLHSPLAFDASTYEIWVPLLRGQQIVIAPPGKTHVQALAQTIVRGQVTALFVTAALFRLLAEEPACLAQIRTIWSGGEAASPQVFQQVLDACPQAVVVNVYGPTETTTFVISFPMHPPLQVGTSVPIGTPMDNTQAYVLDSALQPTPTGVTGELYIGGSGLARGYLERAALTAERFVANPHGTPGSRIYRTGDLVRWRADGQIEFVGRIDHQVKIRGFRIELGEIEARLTEHACVREAVVLAREDSPGDKRLVAYVAPVHDGVDAQVQNLAATLRIHLGARLPDYMIPAAFVSMETFPLTPNGKLDRRALHAPEKDAFVQRAYEPPQNEIEMILAELWQELLGVDHVGRHDHFFELGGHSLTAFRLISRIKEEFDVFIDLRTIFDNPVLASLAEIILIIAI